MDRRTLVRSVGAGLLAATAGCAGGTVVHDVQRQLRIEAGRYWVSRLPGVDGSGAISYTVRAESRFDVYVFTERADFDRYEAYHQDEAAAQSPTGHEDLQTTAVYEESRERYTAATTDGGARQSFDTASESYFVVDHSGYGMGAEPPERAGPLRAFVDLEIVEKRIGL